MTDKTKVIVPEPVIEKITSIIGKYFDEKNIFTFGKKDSQAFSFAAPREIENLYITIVSTPRVQNAYYGSGHYTYEEFTIHFYIHCSVKEIKEGQEMADAIFTHVRENPLLIEDKIFGVFANSPQYLGEQQNQKHLFMLEINGRWQKK